MAEGPGVAREVGLAGLEDVRPRAEGRRRDLAARGARRPLDRRPARPQDAPGDDGAPLEAGPRVGGGVARVRPPRGAAQGQRPRARRCPPRSRPPRAAPRRPPGSAGRPGTGSCRPAARPAPPGRSRPRRRRTCTCAPAALRTDHRDETRLPLQANSGAELRVIAGGEPVIAGAPGGVATWMCRRLARTVSSGDPGGARRADEPAQARVVGQRDRRGGREGGPGPTSATSTGAAGELGVHLVPAGYRRGGLPGEGRAQRPRRRRRRGRSGRGGRRRRAPRGRGRPAARPARRRVRQPRDRMRGYGHGLRS